MIEQTTKEYQDHNNVYAFNLQNEAKHISEVESGKKGYYCMGCGREMQAKRGEVRFQHFSHDPKDVLKKGKCTFSDETYRHKIAKEILQRIKRIKVPTLYKFAPSGTEGKAVKIRDSHFITASVVQNELQFFEDEHGNIGWGNNINFENQTAKHLQIQPDVTFFDVKGQPILFIELVATHKITSEKLVRIKRLGIDTIQVRIPKDSSQAIEDAFNRTERTEWIYNYEQDQTQYIPSPERIGEGIPLINEFQRSLLKATESFACRDSQIKNLIRSIGKSLSTEQFRNAQQSIRAEIRRVEENTERNRIRFRDLQEEQERAIEEEFRSELDELEEETKRIRGRREELESRYYRKRDEIEQKLRSMGRGGITVEERIEEIRADEKRITDRYRKEESTIELNTINAESEIQRIDNELTKLREEFEVAETKLRSEFEGSSREIIDAIAGRDSRGSDGINRKIKDIIEAGEAITIIAREAKSYKRLRKAKDALTWGDWKNW